MGSSGGSSNFKQPTIPTAPNSVPYGQTSSFTPSYVNFLGDPSVPSTGLTPAMLQQIDSGAYAKPVQASQEQQYDRNLLAQIMAQLQQQQQANSPSRFDRAQERFQPGSRFANGIRR